MLRTSQREEQDELKVCDFGLISPLLFEMQCDFFKGNREKLTYVARTLYLQAYMYISEGLIYREGREAGKSDVGFISKMKGDFSIDTDRDLFLI